MEREEENVKRGLVKYEVQGKKGRKKSKKKE